MPNAILTKYDGTITSIPPASVVAILSTALDAPDADRPQLRSIVITTYRGMASDFLLHTAADAAGEIAKAGAGKRGALRLGRAKPWLELDCGGDVTRIQPGSAPAYETVKVEGEERLRVWWTRPDNQVVALDVDSNEANRARLDADHEGKD